MTSDRSSMRGPDASVSRVNTTSMLAGFALGAVLASFAWVQILPSDANGGFDPSEFAVFQGNGPSPAPVDGEDDGGGTERRVITQGGGEGGGGDATGGATVGGGGGGGEGSEGSGGAGSGDTTGVSDSAIKLGATYVSGGLACDFLCEVRDAMEAVRNRVNRGGGVHGRQLQIDYKADDWDPTRGQTFIENLINDGVFAFAVSPSSEGLNAAARAGLFERNGVPVVGADGLNNSQFINVQTGEANPWIWPVATATTTNVHIIMKEAWDRSGGDLRPAIVFGNTYRFGVEGAYAFNQAYKRLSGNDIPGYSPGETGCQKGSRYCGIDGGWSGGAQDDNLKDACESGDPCNFILVLLEPSTALNWMANFGISPDGLEYGMAGAQPLFTTNFGDQCKEKCEGMVVWTGYNPASEFQQKPEVAEYSQALTAQKASADVDNQFSMGGYVGMQLLVEALEEAGKDLDRGKLIDALNSITLETGLTAASSLSWSADNKYANDAAHGFRMQWNDNQGTFAGFDRSTDYVTENPDWLGEDNQPPG